MKRTETATYGYDKFGNIIKKETTFTDGKDIKTNINEKEERERRSSVRSESIKDEIIAVLRKYDVAIRQVGNWFTAIEQKIGYIKL